MASDKAALSQEQQPRVSSAPLSAPKRETGVSSWQTAVFALIVFLSAFLLFQVQLLVGKRILPWFGGSAAVWTTSLLVYQLLLLGGYLYSHNVVSRLISQRQALIHVALLAAALFLVIALSILWPSAVTPGTSFKPTENGNPALQVVGLILISAGLPFFVLSTTGPLLQGWFAALGGGGRTYRLYAVSNTGSLLGLLTFPFILEPNIRLTTLGKAWSFLFACFAVGCAICAWWFRSAPASKVESRAAQSEENSNSLTWLLWFSLAACASALLLAATNLLCQEVTSIPLFWVLPLSIYLVTFILCFESSRWYRRSVFHPLFVVGAMATCVPLIYGGTYRGEAALIAVTLFSAWMVCHGELALLKPNVKDLTAFYLAVSAGGAAGGIFVAVFAPLVFNSFIEFQLCLALVVVLGLICLIRDPESWIFHRSISGPIAISIGMLVAGYAAQFWNADLYRYLTQRQFFIFVLLVGLVAVSGSLITAKAPAKNSRGFRFVHLAVALVVISVFALLYASTRPVAKLLVSRRNFYGVIQVHESKNARLLLHGRTLHGAQLNPPYENLPVTYYGPESGIGIVLANHPKRTSNLGPLRVGAVGLGAGSVAAYGQPGDSIRFYELDPAVVDLSLNEKPVFTFLRSSRAKVSVAVGDGRLLLEGELARGQRQQFDVLILDAFSGDAIPVHLLTEEAFQTYWQQVDADSGLIAVHISSQHVNLLPVLLGIAKRYQTPFVIRNHIAKDPFMSSSWVLLARRPDTLSIPGLGQAILPDNVTDETRLWTDDKSDVFRLLR